MSNLASVKKSQNDQIIFQAFDSFFNYNERFPLSSLDENINLTKDIGAESLEVAEFFMKVKEVTGVDCDQHITASRDGIVLKEVIEIVDRNLSPLPVH